jgi:endonuclease YncB( thermonuclease family)
MAKRVMRTWTGTFGLAVFALALAGSVSLGAEGEIKGAPRIIGGDTLEIGGKRIRLYGIAAPAPDQTCHHGGREYQCGKVARATLWDLVAGRDVVCEPVPDAEKGVEADGEAIVANCSVGGASLSQNMVQSGWALADRRVSEQYVGVEEAAKEAGSGLWSGQFDLPWTWRQGSR